MKRLQLCPQKIGMTILLLLLIRFMSHIPVPGVKHSMFKLAVAGKGNGYFQLYDRLTGGSFSNMTIFGAGITPYITASIVVQLLGYTSKRLNQMYHEGEYGRRTYAENDIVNQLYYVCNYFFYCILYTLCTGIFKWKNLYSFCWVNVNDWDL